MFCLKRSQVEQPGWGQYPVSSADSRTKLNLSSGTGQGIGYNSHLCQLLALNASPPPPSHLYSGFVGDNDTVVQRRTYVSYRGKYSSLSLCYGGREPYTTGVIPESSCVYLHFLQLVASPQCKEVVAKLDDLSKPSQIIAGSLQSVFIPTRVHKLLL